MTTYSKNDVVEVAVDDGRGGVAEWRHDIYEWRDEDGLYLRFAGMVDARSVRLAPRHTWDAVRHELGVD